MDHSFYSLGNDALKGMFVVASKYVSRERYAMAQELLGVHVLNGYLPALLVGVTLHNVLQIEGAVPNDIFNSYGPKRAVDPALGMTVVGMVLRRRVIRVHVVIGRQLMLQA
jgi:hypothetical protein